MTTYVIVGLLGFSGVIVLAVMLVHYTLANIFLSDDESDDDELSGR